MNFVKPIQVMSPYSGRWVKPRLTEHVLDGNVVVEARWYCPSSGEFMQKGIVEVRPANPDTEK